MKSDIRTIALEQSNVAWKTSLVGAFLAVIATGLGYCAGTASPGPQTAAACGHHGAARAEDQEKKPQTEAKEECGVRAEGETEADSRQRRRQANLDEAGEELDTEMKKHGFSGDFKALGADERRFLKTMLTNPQLREQVKKSGNKLDGVISQLADLKGPTYHPDFRTFLARVFDNDAKYAPAPEPTGPVYRGEGCGGQRCASPAGPRDKYDLDPRLHSLNSVWHRAQNPLSSVPLDTKGLKVDEPPTPTVAHVAANINGSSLDPKAVKKWLDAIEAGSNGQKALTAAKNELLGIARLKSRESLFEALNAMEVLAHMKDASLFGFFKETLKENLAGERSRMAAEGLSNLIRHGLVGSGQVEDLVNALVPLASNEDRYEERALLTSLKNDLPSKWFGDLKRADAGSEKAKRNLHYLLEAYRRQGNQAKLDEIQHKLTAMARQDNPNSTERSNAFDVLYDVHNDAVEKIFLEAKGDHSITDTAGKYLHWRLDHFDTAGDGANFARLTGALTSKALTDKDPKTRMNAVLVLSNAATMKLMQEQVGTRKLKALFSQAQSGVRDPEVRMVIGFQARRLDDLVRLGQIKAN